MLGVGTTTQAMEKERKIGETGAAGNITVINVRRAVAVIGITDVLIVVGGTTVLQLVGNS